MSTKFFKLQRVAPELSATRKLAVGLNLDE
jgi:hypothetical protein